MIFLQFAPLTGAMVGAVDITTRQTSPYMEDRERFERSENPLQTDQVDGIALAATFWDGVKSGELRMWESNLGTGVPLGGVIYTRVWSPFYWIGVVVPAPSLSAFAVWLTLWSAQTGAWLLARRIGIGRLGAVLTGVAYGFSGPTTALLLRINEVALAPWVMVATHEVIARRNNKTMRWVVALSIAVAAMWLGGFPAGSLFVLYGAGAIAVGTAVVHVGPRPRQLVARLAPAAGGVVAGTFLASPLIFPSWEFLNASESLDRLFSSDHVAGLEMFGTALSGRILGSYPLGTWWWPNPGYSNPVSASATAGSVVILILLVGAVAARWVRPDPVASRIVGRVYLPMAAVVYIGTFVGGPVLAALQALPFLGSNEFGRSRFLLALALALAAGLVLDGLVRPAGELPTLGRTFRLLAGTAGLAALWGAYLILRRAADEGYLDRALDGLTVPMMSMGIAAVVLLSLPILRKTALGSWASVLVIVLALAVELQWGAWEFTPIVDRDEGFLPDHPAFEVMRPDVSEGQYRFAGTSLNVIRPNTGAWLDLADLRVSNPSYEGYRELMRAVDPDVFDRARLRTWFTSDLDPSSPGLDRSAVRFLVAPAIDGVLEASPVDELLLSPIGHIEIPRADRPTRGLRFEFDRERCSAGFLTLRVEEEVVGRRPLWQLRQGSFDVAIEDVRGPAQLTATLEGCDLSLPSTVVVLRALSDTGLRVRWADDAIIYERLDTRPRFEMATAVLGIGDRDRRLEFLVHAEDTAVVVLDDDRPLTELNGGEVQLLEDTGDRLKLQVWSDGPGLVIIRDSNAPGWRARIDRESVPIQSADHAYRAINVPSGDSILELTYLPASRLLGFGAAGLAVMALTAATLLARRRRSQPGRSEPSPDGEPS